MADGASGLAESCESVDSDAMRTYVSPLCAREAAVVAGPAAGDACVPLSGASRV